MSRKRRNRKQSLKVLYFPEDKVLQRQGYKYSRLTPSENKLLICLSTGNLESIEELTKYLKITETNLRIIKKRLVDKTKLNIEAITNSGYILRDYLFIESSKKNEFEYVEACINGEENCYEKYSKRKDLSQKGASKEQKKLGNFEKAIVIYNPVTRTLRRENVKEYQLTDLENKFIMCLSSGLVAKYEDLEMILEISLSRLHKLKRELVNKTHLNIEYQTNVGYVLRDDLKVESLKSARMQDQYVQKYLKNIKEKLYDFDDYLNKNNQEELDDEYAM